MVAWRTEVLIMYSTFSWEYRKTCPFCGREHLQRMSINIICPCGAKYYFHKKQWIDRKAWGVGRADNG